METKIHKKSEVSFKELAKFIIKVRKQVVNQRGLSLDDLVNHLENEWPFISYVLTHHEGELAGYALLFQIGDSDLVEINPGGLLGHHPIAGPGFDEEEVVSELIQTSKKAVIDDGFNAFYIDIPWDPEEPQATYDTFKDRYGKFGFEVIQLVRQMSIALPVKDKELSMPPDVEWVQIQEADEEALFQCHHQAYLKGNAQYYFQMDEEERRNDFERIYAPNIRKHPASLALIQNGEILGYSLLFGKENFSELMSLAVHPDHRRGGYARILLQNTLHLAGKEGHKNMILIVDVKNKAASNLYNQTGFTDSGSNMTFKWKA
jgi:ribosomal protein S18 acetylase RimI-like enzyme